MIETLQPPRTLYGESVPAEDYHDINNLVEVLMRGEPIQAPPGRWDEATAAACTRFAVRMLGQWKLERELVGIVR